MKYTTAFILLILIVLIKVKAQTLDDPIYFNYSALPFTSIENANGQLDINYFETNLAAPIIKFGERIQFINTFYYRYSNFEYSDDTPEINRGFSNSLHDIRYSAIFRAKLSDKFELLSIARVLLRSDLQGNLAGSDFFPFGLLLGNFTIKGNPDFTVGLGIALNSDFNYNAVIPIATLRYKSEKVKVEVVYPNANFIYRKSDSFEFGLFANVDGSISRVAQNSLGVNDENVQFQRNFQVLVAPTVSHRIYNQIFGHLKIGVAPISSLQLLDNRHEEIEVYTQRFDPSLFIRTGISYRLK